MSYTEIYKFNKDGEASFYGEAKNSHRGCIAVWNYLDEKYLPPYMPEWTEHFPDDGRRHYRSLDLEALRDVWNLYNDDRLSENEKIVLGTTFDNCIVLKDDIPRVIQAFQDFAATNTNLVEQAAILEEALKDDGLIAVAWNQTSVNGEAWEADKYLLDEDGEPYHPPYNLYEEGRHWSLFDED